MGFMSTWGASLAASAWTIWARPISRPSGVIPELLDMFWDLKGATFSPLSTRILQIAAAIIDLPTSEPVPRTAILFFIIFLFPPVP